MQVHRRSNVEVKVIPDSSGYTSDRSSHKIPLPMLCPSLFQILATPLHDTLVGSSFGVAGGRMSMCFRACAPNTPPLVLLPTYMYMKIFCTLSHTESSAADFSFSSVSPQTVEHTGVCIG